MFLIFLFVLKNYFNTLRRAVGLILRDREHDIDLKLAVRGGGIIVLQNGLPVAVMFFQDGLCIVVVLHIPEPAVQFCDKDKVDFTVPDIIQETHKFFAVLQFFRAVSPSSA